MRKSYKISAALVVALALVASVALAATPVPNSFLVHLKVWNDSPASIATNPVNNYPKEVRIDDVGLSGCGFTNMHNWSLSADGGATWAMFENNSSYRMSCDIVLDGNAAAVNGAEAGIRISPWWDPELGGVFMINSASGEIACFSGRLPFYSFTANYGLHYTLGQVVRMEVVYNPHGLSAGSPATITYNYIVNPWKAGEVKYSSGELAFDQANPAEDPPHGLWGELDNVHVGGYFMAKCVCDPDAKMNCSWSNIVFQGGSTSPTTTNSWSRLKKQYK